MKQLVLGLNNDDVVASTMGLSRTAQAQLVELMAQSLLAVINPAKPEPRGDDDDRRSDEPQD